MSENPTKSNLQSSSISLDVRDGKVLNAYGPTFWCHTKAPLCRFIQDVRVLLLPLFMPTYTLDARSSSDVEGRPDTLSTWIRNQIFACERQGEKTRTVELDALGAGSWL